ncbi:MAG TPA: 3-dehydroquinate synthase [Candidatus Sulfotelmatobacter sp.]|jgi:3-dehydroquinate synthase|nr:3-dehydroquinate synthase [Candidatus Sulfotelmatobacter sp.]
MKRITITIKQSTEQAYDIVIGNNSITQLNKLIDLSAYTKIVLITDETIGKWWCKKLLKTLPPQSLPIILPSGEKAKTIKTIQIIWQELLAAGCDRKSVVINLGGGVICDMGSFAAATYMRGIDFINIPTTLLSQVDASVGGKTGFDFAEIKNLIGTFTQPKAVIIDVATLKTLPEREFISGFAEIIKHGLITDKNYFEKVTSKSPLSFSTDELIDIITRSCEIKSTIVEQDEIERDKRKLLNFGHTIGHAIESLCLKTDRPLLHGEAISIGMVAEAMLSQRIGLLNKNDVDLIKNKLANAGLPTTILHINYEKIVTKMKSDKKNVSGDIHFTLLKKIGEGVINQIVKENIIKNTLENL